MLGCLTIGLAIILLGYMGPTGILPVLLLIWLAKRWGRASMHRQDSISCPPKQP